MIRPFGGGFFFLSLSVCVKFSGSEKGRVRVVLDVDFGRRARWRGRGQLVM